MIIVSVPNPDRGSHMPARPGAGGYTTTNAMGTARSMPSGRSAFNHPWKPSIQGANKLTFLVGYVQSLSGDGWLEPKIAGSGDPLPMSGKDGKTPTPLTLDPALADSNGRSWVVLQVKPDDQGELREDSDIQLIHSKVTISKTADLGLKAITAVLWKGGRIYKAIPTVSFDMVYERVVPTAGGGLPRHYFL